jgi:putative Ca2+/H+ antiporter (TMEM165/GDT1 family)
VGDLSITDYSGDMKVFMTVCGAVLVAERGDKTQLATMLFAKLPGNCTTVIETALQPHDA